MAGPILPYKSDKLRIDVDPGRQVLIDCPPIGLARALKVKSAGGATAVITFLTLCVLLPTIAIYVAYFYFHQRDWLIRVFAVPIASGLVYGVVWLIFIQNARVHYTFVATPTTLTIDKCGFGDSDRLVIARDDIEVITACYSKFEGGGSKPATVFFALHIRRRRYDMDDVFLEHMERAEVQTVTDQLCAMLNLKAAPPDPR